MSSLSHQIVASEALLSAADRQFAGVVRFCRSARLPAAKADAIMWRIAGWAAFAALVFAGMGR